MVADNCYHHFVSSAVLSCYSDREMIRWFVSFGCCRFSFTVFSDTEKSTDSGKPVIRGNNWINDAHSCDFLSQFTVIRKNPVIPENQ